MTQQDFLASVPATFLLDTCCAMNLDGRNRVLEGMPAAASIYDDDARNKIWNGLESFAAQGRLKLIREVREELQRLHPDALSRLAHFPRTRMPRVGSDLRRRYQALLSKYADFIPDQDLTHDPADPWLIVTAQKYTFTILTDELREEEKKRKAKHGPQIPDVCDSEGLDCVTLPELAKREGWL